MGCTMAVELSAEGAEGQMSRWNYRAGAVVYLNDRLLLVHIRQFPSSLMWSLEISMSVSVRVEWK